MIEKQKRIHYVISITLIYEILVTHTLTEKLISLTPQRKWGGVRARVKSRVSV